MFLITHKHTSLPEWAILAGSYTTIPQPDKCGWEKPEELVPLKDSCWPEEVIQSIAEAFQQAGIDTPLEQKLVEPFCIAFGGGALDGTPQLENVIWKKVIDYFTWEIATLNLSPEAQRLQDMALKRWGHIFNHYRAYEGYIRY